MASEEEKTAGRHILVVEDEMLICMLIETILMDAGYEVTLANSVPEALAAIENGRFDGAILDLNLKGVKVYPVAERLTAEGTRFIFATGGGGHDLDGFPGRPWVAKPFQEAMLLDALTTLLA